jgi:phosphate butyryltransferase
MLKNFDALESILVTGEKKKIAVAMAHDADILEAVDTAQKRGLAEAILIGSKEKIKQIAEAQDIDFSKLNIVNQLNEKKSVSEAVSIVRQGDAHVVMKGLCSTSTFLKGVLDKEKGLRTGKILSHLAIFENPNYHKLLFMSDAAMNISPTLMEKTAITENAIGAAHRIGYATPKVALLSAVEKLNESMPSSIDASVIAKMGERRQIKNAILDGPLALDNALSKKANEVKGLVSPVGGDADICIVPNIESGNIFYKSLTILGNSRVAGVIIGAAAPVVLTSRADSDDSKFLSIISALAISN